MGSDYPDYTDIMQIVGSDIQVPIDIQGAYIQMPIDIQGAYIQMPVDIQAQYVTLKIDIVAASVEKINVDISAQTISNLTIDINAQHIGMYLQPDWQAKEGNAVKITPGTSGSWAAADYKNHTVGAGKKLYITHFTGYGRAKNSADGDKEAHVIGWLVDHTDSEYYCYIGGCSGFAAVFPTPLVFPENHEVRAYVYWYSNFEGEFYAIARGYEV